MAKNILYRQLDIEDTQFRAITEGNKRYLEGYASVFNSRSKPIYENGRLFYEVIDPHAFDELLQDKKLDVYLTFNHERGRVMARTVSGTLALSVDGKGLKFRAEVPNVTYANDVYELVSRGDLYENSFAFIVNKGDDTWSTDREGNEVRYIRKVSKLIDVSIVTAGAYADTTVLARQAQLTLKKGDKITIAFESDEEEMPEEEIVETPENTEVEEPKPEDVTPIDEDEDDVELAKERMQMHVKILKLKS